jgi:hypothetical protein
MRRGPGKAGPRTNRPHPHEVRSLSRSGTSLDPVRPWCSSCVIATRLTPRRSRPASAPPARSPVHNPGSRVTSQSTRAATIIPPLVTSRRPAETLGDTELRGPQYGRDASGGMHHLSRRFSRGQLLSRERPKVADPADGSLTKPALAARLRGASRRGTDSRDRVTE